MVEFILHNGACGHLLPGWSKTLLKSLEENNLKEIADAVRPGKLIHSFNILSKALLFTKFLLQLFCLRNNSQFEICGIFLFIFKTLITLLPSLIITLLGFRMVITVAV